MSTGKPNYLLLRIVSATCILSLLNAWSIKHLGTGLNDFALINGLALCLGWVLGIANKSERERVEQAWRRVCYGFLQGPVLVVFALLGLTLSLFFTSITLSASDLDRIRQVTFADGITNKSIATKTLSAEQPTVRYVCWTTPFGRALSLDVEGYLRHRFDIYPWWGKRIQIDKVLSPTPTVLLRMPMRKLQLLNAATLYITVNNAQVYRLQTQQGRGSVRVGPARRLPIDSLTNWKVRLLATTEQDERSIARVVWQWQEILDLPEEIILKPGAHIDVALKNDALTVLAESSFKVGRQAFQDILLKPRNL